MCPEYYYVQGTVRNTEEDKHKREAELNKSYH